jgi:hypothetical protein
MGYRICGKTRIMHDRCEVIFRFFQFFDQNPIVKPHVPVYNDIKNFIICYKI